MTKIELRIQKVVLELKHRLEQLIRNNANVYENQVFIFKLELIKKKIIL